MKGAIFDVDGTLLDSMPIWDDAGKRYLETLGITAHPGLGDILYPMTMEGAAAFMKREYHLTNSVQEIVEGVTNVIEQFYREQVLLKEGVSEYLESLQKRGIKMVIATSGDRVLTEAALTRLGICKYFVRIFTCAEVGTGKSKPNIFLRAAEFMGTRPEETWVFEDALHAMEAAKHAGFHVVGVYDKSNEKRTEEIKAICDVYMENLKDTGEERKD